MATVIYANFGDMDTMVLSELWDGLENMKVIEITRRTAESRKIVNKAIEEEKDLLILCGHGSSKGLFSPDSSNVQYLVDSCNVNLIKSTQLIGIWCFASKFAEENNLKGFFSNMFISNIGEAIRYGVSVRKEEDITTKEIEFCQNVRSLIQEKIPMSDWIAILKSKVDMKDSIVCYNYNGLKCYL